jgi:hypothetical protein
MIPLYDPKLEKELKEKSFSYHEVYLMVEHLHKKAKKNKYLAIFLAGIWTPVITMICMTNYDSPILYLSGAIVSTFAFYVFDETHETIYSLIVRKLKNNDKTKK